MITQACTSHHSDPAVYNKHEAKRWQKVCDGGGIRTRLLSLALESEVRGGDLQLADVLGHQGNAGTANLNTVLMLQWCCSCSVMVLGSNGYGLGGQHQLADVLGH
jgi:hypothetical protein